MKGEYSVCGRCRSEGKKSKLFVEHHYCGHAIAEVGGGGYYDEEGKWVDTSHARHCEQNFTIYRCSNGHQWSDRD